MNQRRDDNDNRRMQKAQIEEIKALKEEVRLLERENHMLKLHALNPNNESNINHSLRDAHSKSNAEIQSY